MQQPQLAGELEDLWRACFENRAADGPKAAVVPLMTNRTHRKPVAAVPAHLLEVEAPHGRLGPQGLHAQNMVRFALVPVAVPADRTHMPNALMPAFRLDALRDTQRGFPSPLGGLSTPQRRPTSKRSAFHERSVLWYSTCSMHRREQQGARPSGKNPSFPQEGHSSSASTYLNVASPPQPFGQSQDAS